MITNTITSVTEIIRGIIKDHLRTDGRNSFIYKTDNTWTLSKDYVSSSTIAVFVNGVETETFTYNSDNNIVTITGLTLDDTVVITFSYYKEYSDNEISGFLESSLAYFVQYQYKKVFAILGTSIITINDINPTINELYFIAIIASILINPQNIKISIPDLTIDAVRTESDQVQIREAFSNFQNFLGTISCEEIEV